MIVIQKFQDFYLNVVVPRLFELGQRYQQFGDLLSDNQN